MSGTHFVYLYRNLHGTPLYVGYGRDAQRALDHAKGSHNRRLMAALKRGKYSLETAGPFGSKTMGLAVESVLISSLEPRYNIQPGQKAFRFRPLGFPAKYYDRTIAPELSRRDFIRRQGRWPTPGC